MKYLKYFIYGIISGFITMRIIRLGHLDILLLGLFLAAMVVFTYIAFKDNRNDRQRTNY